MTDTVMRKVGLGVVALVCVALVVSTASAVQTPWGNSYPTWATNTTTTWVSATAAIGVDPPPVQTWGPTITYSIADGASFSTIPYTPSNNTAILARTYTYTTATPNANPNAYMGANNWQTVNQSTYYPDGIDWNNPPNSIQPVGSAPKNVSLLAYRVASRVTSIAGSGSSTYPQTDPYAAPPFEPKLNIRNPATYYNPGTNAAIIAGSYVAASPGLPLTVQWRTRNQSEINPAAGGLPYVLPGLPAFVASDVMKLNGPIVGADYVLQMDYSNEIETPGDQAGDIVNGSLFLGMLINPSGVTQWTNAVNINVVQEYSVSTWVGRRLVTRTETTPAIGKYAYRPGSPDYLNNYTTQVQTKPYLGSFQSFLNSTYTEGGVTHYYYEHSLDELRSTWGVDTSTNTAWAVLNVGCGIFAVVPEPSTVRMLVAGMLCAAFGFWRYRRTRPVVSA